MKHLLLLLASLVFTLNISYGQTEVCDDGIDNDGDGFVDCYDSECTSNAACDDFYLNDDAMCEVGPTEFPTFAMREAYTSPGRTLNNYSTVLTGDLDGDGIPEVVTFHREDRTLYILDGRDLSVKDSRNIGGEGGFQDITAIGNVDGTDCSWIFIYVNNQIRAYDCNLDPQWNSSALKGHPGMLGLADFNYDGNVELYFKDEIYNARTGAKIIGTSYPNHLFTNDATDPWLNTVNAGPIAVDILADSECTDCSGLELVSGLDIYSVDIPNQELTLVKTRSEYDPKRVFTTENWSFTSVADYNQDGYLDVITNGASGSNNATTAFYWDVKNNVLKTYIDAWGGGDYRYGWKNGSGRINIADIDGDGELNATFVAGEYLYALDEDWDLLWRENIVEVTSGNTGCTVFDFNGDGKFEIVYRDESYLYIVNGETTPPDVNGDGTPDRFANRIPCKSRTSREYPVVADVDGDGGTEIIVSCDVDDNININGGSNPQEGQVRMYKSDGEIWVPSRKVWNQHGYFNVNVNDDLTIPREQQKHHKVFSSVLCEEDEHGNPVAGDVRPLNTFLNQSPYLDINGCPTYGAPDLTLDENSAVTIYPATCPETDFYVSFTIANEGDVPFSSKLYVSFYDGDPDQPGAVKLNTDSVTISNLAAGATLQVDSLQVKGPGPDFTLYVKLNDPETIAECEPGNNTFSRDVRPLPFNIEALKLTDNNKCQASLPDNGSARAYVWDGTTETTAGYRFNWYYDNGSAYDSVFTGAIYSGMAEGSYKVTATHNVKGCGSDTVDVEINRTTVAEEWITIEQISPFDNCLSPNGELRARIWRPDGADSVDVTDDLSVNYEFSWYKSSEYGVGAVLSVEDTLSGLEDISYSVDALNPVTGCPISPKAMQVQSNAEYPDIRDIDVVHIDQCGMDGEIDVTRVVTTSGASLNESTDLTYRWYNGADTTGTRIPGETGKEITGLADGDYTVVAVLNANGCESEQEMRTIDDNRVIPVITVDDTTPNSSCDPANPNGSIEIQDTSPNSISWHKYDYVNGDWDLIAGQTAFTINDLDSGWYKAIVRHSVSLCEVEEEIYVPYDPLVVDANLIATAPVDQTNCDTSAPNGSISATYNGTTSGYLFYWSDGIAPKDPADFTGSNYTGLADGAYTVVVADAATLCESLPVTDTIAHTPDNPMIALTIGDQTSCDPGAPNGSVLATASSTIAEPGAGYFFELLDAGAVENSVDNQPGGTGLNSTGLDAGTGTKTYTVRVTNRSNACVSTTPATVIENQTQPDIDEPAIAVTDNINCAAPGSGQIDASAAPSTSTGEPAGGYTYHWYAPDGTAMTETGPALDELLKGFYELEVENNDSKCLSDRVVVEVDENLTYPTVTASLVAEQTACAGGTPNGILSAAANTAGGEPSLGYDFRWYLAGAKVDSTLGVAGPVTADSLTNATYEVIAVNLDTRCEGSDTEYVSETLTYPEINPITVSDNGFCSTPGNGRLDATGQAFMPGPPPEPADGYTYEWYTENDVFIHSDSAVLDSLSAGIYKLIAVNNTTNCASQPESYEIEDDPDVMDIAITSLSDQISCSPDETDHLGALRAEVDEGGVLTASGYTFAWHRGTSTLSAVIGSNNEIYNLTDVTYTVNVTSDSTGCSEDASYKVVENLTYPVVATAVNDVTQCDPYDGWASADIGGTTTGYSFFWSDSSRVKNPVDFTGALYNELEPGFYTVFAVDDNTLCYSDTATVEVEDNSPVISINKQLLMSPAHCDTIGGILRVNVSASSGPGLFDIEWLHKSVVLQQDASVSTSTIDSLSYGLFDIVATNLDNGCTATDTMYLPYDNAHHGIVKNVVPADMCVAPFNSEIEYGIHIPAGVPHTSDEYVYHLYEGEYEVGDIMTPILTDDIFSSIDSLYQDLAPGAYTFSIVDNWSGHNCESQPVYIDIEQSAETPRAAFSIVNNYSCDPMDPNGVLTATASMPTAPPPADYTFVWYETDTTNTPALETAVHLNTSGITNLGPAAYALHLTNNDTGCDTVITRNIITDRRDLTLHNFNIVAQTNCGPDENGEITVGEVRENGVVDGAFTYEIELYAASDLVTPLKDNQSLGVAMDQLDAGDYLVRAINDSTSCVVEKDTIVPIDTRNPLIVRTAISHDEFCAPLTDGNGMLEVAVDESAFGGLANETGGYAYEWFEGSGTTVPIGGAVTENITDLPSGQYTVRITDNNGTYLNCAATRTFTINEDQPEILISSVLTTPQTDCAPNVNGTITVNEATYNGSPTAIPDAAYTIELIAPSITNHTFTQPDGVYELRATHVQTQCVSPVKEVTVDLELPVHTIIFDQTADWSCNNNGMGSLEAAEIRQNNVNTPLTDYTYQWYDNSGNPLPAGANPDVHNLTDGVYRLTITDNTTAGMGCTKTQAVTLLNDPKDIQVSLDPTPQTICLPNGELAVVDVTEDGAITGDTYTHTLVNADLDTLANPGPPYADLAAGSYFVSAVNDNTGCESGFANAVIDDDSENPVAYMAELAKQTAKAPPATPNGEIRAWATEQDASVDTYDFTWYYTGTAVPGGVELAATADTLTAQPSGMYMIEVRNTVTNCVASAQAAIEEDVATPEIEVASQHMTICDPANGSIEVTGVSIVGNPENVADYEFRLYKNSPTNLVATLSGTSGTTFGFSHDGTEVDAGVYFVVAEEINLNIVSNPYRVVIEDNTVAPTVGVREMRPQRSFSSDPADHNGALSIIVNGSVTNNGTYSTRWYQGTSVSGTYLPAFDNQFEATGLTDGYYTIAVTDGNGCMTVATYYVVENRVPVLLSSTARANSLCIGANGQMATVVSNPNASYHYYWYTQGSYPADPADYTGQMQQGIPAGTYYVYVVDQDDPYRFGVDTVEVRNSFYYPDITIEELHAQVNCDPERPSGELQASINNNYSMYEIHWFEETSPQDIIGENSWIMTGLPALAYVAEVQNVITGCQNASDPFQVSENLDIVPAPVAQIISHRTRCDAPNGAIQASVEGVAFNHQFHWHVGSSTSGSPVNAVMIDELEPGPYTVTATSVATGCVSQPVTAMIEDARVYPEFDIAVVNATCDQENGSASIYLTNNSSVESIVWSGDFATYYDYQMADVPAGQYSVTVNTNQQCETTEQFEIKPDINVFNGISANGDGLNDHFIVGCIESYENANVKIFNRSGDKVFEMNGYDNDVNSFDGYGNRGLYIGRPELPIGTYFYIIDLRDGTEPKTGYLELVR